jgi:anti-sigma factor RsiW
MCPDPQILSIYLDGELPSPWKEKMESHFLQCSACREKLENLKHLKELLNADAGKNRVENEPKFMEDAKARIWQRLESGRRFRGGAGLWRRRLSVPLPAAAAAAVIITLLAALWLRDERIKSGGFAQQPQEPVNFILAAEEEIPGVIPAADINGVLQYLTSDGTDVIILRLPESRNFFRTGDPAIIRAADYSRRQP